MRNGSPIIVVGNAQRYTSNRAARNIIRPLGTDRGQADFTCSIGDVRTRRRRQAVILYPNALLSMLELSHPSHQPLQQLFHIKSPIICDITVLSDYPYAYNSELIHNLTALTTATAV